MPVGYFNSNLESTDWLFIEDQETGLIHIGRYRFTACDLYTNVPRFSLVQTETPTCLSCIGRLSYQPTP